MNAILRLSATSALAGLLLCACDSRDAGSKAARSLKVHRDEAGLQSCLTHPDPIGYTWSRASVDAFCSDQYTDAITRADVVRMIEAGQGRQLDVEYDALVDDYLAGRLPEGSARRAYIKIFAEGDQETGALIDRWVEQSPTSAHALAARGMYRTERAIKSRGMEIAKDTPREKFEAMGYWLKRAQPDIEQALHTNPRILAAYESMIHLASLASNDDLAEKTLADTLKIDPTNFYVRVAYSLSKQPRWGGSLKAMDDLATEAETLSARNPRMAGLRMMALVERAEPYLREKKFEDVLREYERGLAHCPSPNYMGYAGSIAQHLQQHEHAIELFTQALRFNPNDRHARLNRARSHHSMKNFAAASADIDDQLRRTPDDLGMASQVASIYLYEWHDPKSAEPLVAALLMKEPKNGAAWLMRVDVIHELKGQGLREASENFMRYVDRSNEWQRNAVPKVEAWLASNPTS